MRHRVAAPADIYLYFDWANDPDTRRQSFNSEPIVWETHEAWFVRKLTDQNALLLVFETETGEPIGQARFEKQLDGEVVIGVSLDEAYRGRGLASQLVADGCAACRKRWDNVPVLAYIKPGNVASIRAFERAGFVQTKRLSDMKEKVVQLVMP
jgi:RimJ/RimL family protein N-acetyltransferase